MSSLPDRQVDVFMIGASKCGTTSLAEALNASGSISTGIKKEPRYFSDPSTRDTPIAQYHANYDANRPIWVDASTTYSEVWKGKNERSAARIQAYRPDAKILMLVRHPMARIISEWRQFIYLIDAGNPTIGPNYGVHDPKVFSQDIYRFPDLLENSRYTSALAPYVERFPKDNILILPFELLSASNSSSLDRLDRFLALGGQLAGGVQLAHRNSGSIKGAANPLGRALRRVPVLKRLGARLPLGLLQRIRPLIKRDPDTGLDLKAEVVEICREALHEDTRAFLDRWGADPSLYDDWAKFRTQ